MDTIVQHELEPLVCLQLAAAAVASRDGVLSIKSMYNNIRKFVGDFSDLEYVDFLVALEAMRHLFEIPKNGGIGSDINYLSIGRDHV